MGWFFGKSKSDVAASSGQFRAQGDEPFSNARARAKRGKASDDPILPEKKRARRRLIGAVVLVLAVVIVLPMILDPEPKPLNDDIAIQIPSRDAHVSALASPLDKEAVDEAAPGAEAADKDANKDANVADKPTSAPVLAAPSQADTSAATAVSIPVPPVPIQRAPAPAKRVEPPALSEEQRALAILQGKSVPPAPSPSVPPAKHSFAIQVAALATQEKIDELRNKLSAAGIKSYTQKVATEAGERTRIRVGPFASREAAEKTRVQIAKLGLNATLVPS